MQNTLFSLGLLLVFQTASGQFQMCNSFTSKNLRDVLFVDQNIGVAVGDSGTIIRSVDGGLNWTTVMSNDTVQLTKVKFFDAQHGIAVGSHIYISNDSGQSWSNIPHGNNIFYDVAILNATTCLVSGEPTALIKSSNLGQSFSGLVSQFNYNMGLLSFVSEDIGYACNTAAGGASPTLKTLDGGISWDTLPSGQNTNTVMEAMSFVSESTGFKGGWYNGHLDKTTNGANDWSAANYTDALGQGQLIDFHIVPSLPNAYYACGWYGEIYKSIDGGDNWFTLNSGLSSTTTLNGIYFINESTGWAVGAYGTVIKTTTGGQVVGIDEIREENPLRLFPNPTKDQLTIGGLNDAQIQQVEIYGIYGQRLMVENQTRSLNVEFLSPGVYMVKINTESNSYLGKFVKE